MQLVVGPMAMCSLNVQAWPLNQQVVLAGTLLSFGVAGWW